MCEYIASFWYLGQDCLNTSKENFMIKNVMGFGMLLFVFVQTGCAISTAQGKTKILDPGVDDNLGGTGTESGDVRAMAERMAREIVSISWPTPGVVPRISVLPLDNQTRFRIDPKLLQNKLTKDLVNFANGRVIFLARDSEMAVMSERTKKRAGIYEQGKSAKAMAGADYFLKGEMRSLSKASREGVSDYLLYSFSLIDAETGGILWMGDYETKKQGSTGVIYQ
jgi:PBP1b-binding outer membrane lipoprotein LpoB